MHFKTVFLDLDNTLFSFDEMYKKTSKEAIRQILGFQNLGVDFETFYRTFRSEADLLYAEYEEGKRSMDSYRDERWLKTFQHYHIPFDPVLLGKLNGFILSHYLDFVEPYEGAETFLQRLGQHVQMGLITNGPAQMQTDKLRRMNLDRYFDPRLIITSEECGAAKPKPQIFHEALAKAWSSPHEALHMGDSVFHDIAGANAVGMSSALIHTSKGNEEVMPTYHFENFFAAADSMLDTNFSNV